jgi:hypothetical protein
MFAWVQANWGLVFGVLFAIDQLLASIPSIKANSVFQVIGGLLSASAPPKPPAA